MKTWEHVSEDKMLNALEYLNDGRISYAKQVEARSYFERNAKE